MRAGNPGWLGETRGGMEERTAPRLTRRQVLGAAAAIAGLAAWPRGLRPSELLTLVEAAVAGDGTSLARRIVLGGSAASAFRPLAGAAGEGHTVRTLGGVSADPGRSARRSSILHLVHITDVHLVDTQSPARVEFLDRLNDGPGSSAPFSAAWRPHEVASTQIAAAMTSAIRAAQLSPVTGAAASIVVNTGDGIDNLHEVELRWAIDILDGGRIAPDTGGPGYQGVQDSNAASFDQNYYHPADPSGDDYGPRGWPALPGFIDAAMTPFSSPGVGLPWLTCFGNHDGLVQGNAPGNAGINAIATGTLKPTLPPAGLNTDAATFLAAYSANPAAVVGASAPRVVGGDPRRRLISHQDYIAAHFQTTGTPVGHGFSAANLAADTGYYVNDTIAGVRLICLDTLNRGGYNDGSLDQAQLTWLQARLDEVSSRRLDSAGNWTSAPVGDRLVLVFSHHTIDTMSNPTIDPANPGQRVTGSQVVSLLTLYPNVVAWINGHTHYNKVTAIAGVAGRTPGFWEINTAAHIDWPSQSRLVELVDNHDGTLSIFGTLVDHAGGLTASSAPGDAIAVAATARALAANDPQKGVVAFPSSMGAVEDRNVELLLPMPFRRSGSATGSTGGASSSSSLPDTAMLAAESGAGMVAAGMVLGAATVVLREARRASK